MPHRFRTTVPTLRSLLLALPLAAIAAMAQAAPDRVRITEATPGLAPDLSSLPVGTQRLAPALDRFTADLASLEHFYDLPQGAARREALRAFYRAWQQKLASVDWSALGLEDRIDALLLTRELGFRLRQLDRDEARLREMAPLLPGIDALITLIEDRRLMRPQQGQDAADVLDRVQRALAAREAELARPETEPANPTVAFRAAETLKTLRDALQQWHAYYAGYDPTFTWWVQTPYASLDETLQRLSNALRKTAGADDPETIIGDPIGREALVDALAYEFIPYSPEELIRIADRELAWCQRELVRAARELGYADWHQALEHVKRQYVPPGEQPQLVRMLAWEAIDYVEQNDLVTVPEIAKRDWRMNMLSAERQLQAPFFLGGKDVWVAFPTTDMPHEKKMMSLRGNNRHFSRAVVHHELIPGHHLQRYMTHRYQTQRRWLETPFWVEGWALYWEFLLYERGFAQTPEDRIGMLFWRSHRAARIKFSLGFHLGQMTPQQAIDLLVNEVGHERENAAAEVRRSFAGDYSPLYQAAYMIGGLQFQALHRELVGAGRMSDRAFHDAILQGGPIPVELVRLRLLGEAPAPNYRAHWRFYDLDR